MQVDGEDITFEKVYNTQGATNGSFEGAEAAAGYVPFTKGINPNQMWAWAKTINKGWTAKTGTTGA